MESEKYTTQPIHILRKYHRLPKEAVYVDHAKRNLTSSDHYFYFARKEELGLFKKKLYAWTDTFKGDQHYYANLLYETFLDSPLDTRLGKVYQRFRREQPDKVRRELRGFMRELMHAVRKAVPGYNRALGIIKDMYQELAHELVYGGGVVYLPGNIGTLQTTKFRPKKAMLDVSHYNKTGEKRNAPLPDWMYSVTMRHLAGFRRLRNYAFESNRGLHFAVREAAESGKMDYPMMTPSHPSSTLD